MLIERFYEHVVGQDEYSFYKLTKYARRILNNIFNVFYVIRHDRQLEVSIKMTDRSTVLSPEMYLSNYDNEKDRNDTAEEITKKIIELMMEV